MIKLRTHPKNNWLEASGYSKKQQEAIYLAQLQDILDNTRWYLDNLENMQTYRVHWHRYRKGSITLPYKHERP
jgi:hypothetical protein